MALCTLAYRAKALYRGCWSSERPLHAYRELLQKLRRDRTIYTDRCERLATVRPSADLLFETVSECYGDATVGVILSGRGRDGAEGVRTMRERGGFVIAQDRVSSAEFGMPCSAIETRRVDLVLPLDIISFALNTLFHSESAVAQN